MPTITDPRIAHEYDDILDAPATVRTVRTVRNAAAAGVSYKEIGWKVGISPATVRRMVTGQGIYGKGIYAP